MNIKLLKFIIVLGLFFGLIFIIGKKRNIREKERLDEKAHSEREQFVRDSLQNIQASSERTNFDIITKPSKGEGRNYTQKYDEDLSSYVNTSITNLKENTSISVIIIDENGNISSSISSSIANIYSLEGNIGNTGLLRSSFIHNSKFQELYEGKSDIIEKLKLIEYVDYLALGKIKFEFRQSTLVEGSIICKASISMCIISASQKSIDNSFSFSVNGNGVSESQAKEDALQKLIHKIKNEYSTL